MFMLVLWFELKNPKAILKKKALEIFQLFCKTNKTLLSTSSYIDDIEFLYKFSQLPKIKSPVMDELFKV